MIQRIVSGGQTGVDRAALDAALALGIPCGGWCPKGRKAEDGPIPDRYPLAETPSARYAQRTRWNVRDSDATLILSPEPLEGGTALTLERARALNRPVFIADPFAPNAARAVRAWLQRARPATLNVAGPRESQHPGIHARALALLRAALAGLLAEPERRALDQA